MVPDRFSQIEPNGVEGFISPFITLAMDRPAGHLSAAVQSTSLLQFGYLGTTEPHLEHHFAQRLAELFQSQLTYLPADLKDLSPQFTKNTDLLIYEEPAQSRLKTWFCGPPACRMVSRWSTSIMVARQPRWPLRKVLLITRGLPQDYMATSWAAQLAPRAEAKVTVLAVQPSLSTANSQALYGEGLSTWLRSDTALGQQLRCLVNALSPATGCPDLQFRGGSSGSQIREAVSETEPDLLVIASDPVEWWEQRIWGDLVAPLLRWADRPVLVAKSSCGLR